MRDSGRDADDRLDADPFRLAGRTARRRDSSVSTMVSKSVFGGSVHDRVARLDGHAGRARGHRGRLLGWGGGGVGRGDAPARPGVEGRAIERQTVNNDRPSASGATATRIWIDEWLPLVVCVWLAGVTLFIARLALGCWGVHRLRVASRAQPASPWQSVAERLAVQLRLDSAFRVVESGLVDAPGVIGSIRPVILLPVAVLTNLTPGQVEALLVHELAHIRRRDYAVNLLQTVAETLLFFHPAVWWVSSRIREEREHCCDDVAVGVSGEPIAYASALAGAGLLADSRRCSVGWRRRRAAPCAHPQAARRARRRSSSVRRRAGGSGGWHDARRRRCPAIDSAEFLLGRCARDCGSVSSQGPPAGRLLAHARDRSFSRSTIRQTWICTPSASRGRRNVPTSGSAPT